MTSEQEEEKAESAYHPSEEAPPQERVLAKLVHWFDARLGLSYELLRPAPTYSVNPFYWLGALAVVAFAIQGVTGAIMMIYYIPTPLQAYSSTLYIFQNVSYGRFLETVHLYTAYAMIMLAFMHMMRGYFVSVNKKPRELMWITGMVMGFVTLGFGFTGYLLPWTVVSKSATDVGIGMMSALPQPLSNFIQFLIVGSGTDSGTVLRFYDLHVVVLPGVLLLLLVGKMYMLEAHGVSEPVAGPVPLPAKKRRLIPIFPDLTVYLLELAAMFGAAMMLISLAFPLNLAPEYTPTLAAQYASQPDWYFLWIYQVLKIQVFEGPGLTVALGLVSLVFVALVLLPFLDRGKTRRIESRRNWVTLGLIFVAEVAVLTVWGYETPGAIIPTEQAALVLGGTAILIALVSAGAYKVIFRKMPAGTPSTGAQPPASPGASYATRSFNTASLWTATSFVVLLTLGTFGINGSIEGAVQLISQGTSLSVLWSLVLSFAELSVAVAGTVYLLYRLDLGTGSIKRRVRAFEVGWKQ
jgi:quinol-cytochrome oxidoreductase complex cytochrome b subunit